MLLGTMHPDLDGQLFNPVASHELEVRLHSLEISPKQAKFGDFTSVFTEKWNRS